MLLSASELELSYGHQRLLAGATLAVEAGEKVGLVGRNGCGKTSLLKILSGDQEADSGEVSRRRGLRVGVLPQEFELREGATVRENIESGAADLMEWLRRYEMGEGTEVELADCLHGIEAADGWNLGKRIEAEASVLGVPDLGRVVAPLSGGEKRRVALCRALVGQPDLLLLDEPTNHLDAESIRWLEGFLRTFPGAVIFVTHDRYFLDRVATRVVELDGGRCFSHPGNYTAYLESKAIRQQIAEQAERRRQRFLRVELEWVREGVRAQRSKSRHRLDTFYNVAGLEAPPEERDMDLIIPPPPEMGNSAVEAVNLGACVGEGGEQRWLFRFLDLALKPGQCTGIVGRNGVGKTTLLRMCLGEIEPDEGTVTVNRRVSFNKVDQERMQLNPEGTVLEEVADDGDTVCFGEKILSGRAYLRRFLFDEDRIKERVGRLSGGERARLMLAKVLKCGGNFLVLDEPTNDLDLTSLRLLEEALAHFGGTVLVVSHDRYFLDRICDQIVAFEDGGVYVQPGNYSYYLEKKQERDEWAKEAAGRVVASGRGDDAGRERQVVRPAKPRKLNNKLREELAGMERAICEAEARVVEIEATLNDPEFYVRRAAEAPGLVEELDVAKAEVQRLYARWEELEAIQSGAAEG
jgi:ATP-binding cassette subfamily F protein uup